MIEYENLNAMNKSFLIDYQSKFDSVLKSGWFILGNEVKEFEKEFAQYCGSTYSTGVANGLDALVLALRCFEFRPGSEVIVPSNTYIATILSILNNNLVPVLVEPDINTYNIDPKKIQEAITPKTVAIMVVHLYGKCCAMDPVVELSKKFNLKLIEDCAQSHGAKFKNRKSGSFGEFGAFSFYPTKNLGALGDAGALNTNDENLNRAIRLYRNYGSEKKYYNEKIGVNSRLDELQAAFLRVKLGSLDKINDHKRVLAAIYQRELKGDFIKPVVDKDYYDVFHIYNIRHPERDALKEYLLKNEIKTEIHYPVAPHRQQALKGMFDGKLYPISEEIHDTTLSLPISYMHTENDVHKVIEVMNKF
ncbi:MAG: DegT/DnrJ/EryC1/StrS family aminotransferase [Cyclobacteriaceae bacterium]|nr:DegT/DnrJ/EryC1/StrS family aminotransferase [Cyclobacteriaceae bacterium]